MPSDMRSSEARAIAPSLYDAFGEDPALCASLNPVFDLLCERYFRVQVLFPERVPAGPCLIVSNHAGALPLDGLLARAILRRHCGHPEARWLVEDELAHAPFVGTLLARLGAVRACPENALRLLATRAVVTFPEGVHGRRRTYSKRRTLAQFGRGGFVKLALRAKVPIVPLAIVGVEDSSPRLGTLPLSRLGLPELPLTPPIPLPALWKCSFLPPRLPSVAKGEGAQEQVLALAASIRDELQGELERLGQEAER